TLPITGSPRRSRTAARLAHFRLQARLAAVELRLGSHTSDYRLASPQSNCGSAHTLPITGSPRRSRTAARLALPSPRLQQVFLGHLGDFEADHGVAEVFADAHEDVGVLV